MEFLTECISFHKIHNYKPLLIDIVQWNEKNNLKTVFSENSRKSSLGSFSIPECSERLI